MNRLLTFVLIIFAAASCSTMRKFDMVSYSALHPLDYEITNNLLIASMKFDEHPNTAMIFITGSGCTSLEQYMPAYLRGMSGRIEVFGVEKKGVVRGDFGLKCAEEFQKYDDFDHRLARQSELLRKLEMDQFERIVLLGVSEGGPIAAKLAAQNPSVDMVAMIGAGGLPQRQSLDILRDKYGAPFDTREIDRLVKAGADIETVIYGKTLRYWRSYLDVDTRKDVAELNVPVHVIMGEKDMSEPIESLYALRELERANISTHIVEGADHTLIANGQDQKPVWMVKISEWIAGL